jgi:hypothetical protein
MGKTVLFCLLFAFLDGLLLPTVAQEVPPAAITVIHLEGSIEYSRAEWVVDQPLQIGAQLYVDDFIYPQNASLTVLCPDGQLIEFSSRQLQPNSTINCARLRSTELVVSFDRQLRLDVQRGGRQDPTIPYLISPRATLVRDQNVTLRWQHVDHAVEYTLTVFADSAVVWESGSLSPLDVSIQDHVASIALPVALEPSKAYSVEICVLLDNLQSGCTSDPGWNTGSNLAFYYDPLEPLAELEPNIDRALGTDTPEALYARAVLLSQPSLVAGKPMGAYGEAIDLLEAIKRDYPDSAISRSPEYYVRLANLYHQVQLPVSAAQAFASASALAQPDSEVYARATMGLAATAPDPSIVAHLYFKAAEVYEGLLTESAFATFLHNLCTAIGNLCAEVCSTYTC